MESSKTSDKRSTHRPIQTRPLKRVVKKSQIKYSYSLLLNFDATYYYYSLSLTHSLSLYSHFLSPPLFSVSSSHSFPLFLYLSFLHFLFPTLSLPARSTRVNFPDTVAPVRLFVTFVMIVVIKCERELSAFIFVDATVLLDAPRLNS